MVLYTFTNMCARHVRNEVISYDSLCVYESSICFRGKRSSTKRATDVYQIPDAGAGEGVSHESLPDQEKEDRDGARPVSHRKADQNLVPEQEDETEEGNPGD